MKRNPFLPKHLALLLLAAPLTFAACDKDNEDPKPANDNELITTVVYSLKAPAGSTAPNVSITWEDRDGEGGAAPVVTGGTGGRLTLRPNTVYTGDILLLDRTKTPADTISNEVAEEADEHLFVYEANPAALLGVVRTDRDANRLEVGLKTTATTAAAGTGTLKITLRHQPPQANGTRIKDGTFGPGDTDVAADFPLTVQ